MSFLPHFLFTPHVGQDSSGPSPRLWSQVYSALTSPDGASRLVYSGDDFTSFYGTVATNVGDYASDVGYKSYEDTGDSITQLADEKGGAIRFVTDTTDNDELWLSSGGATGVLGAISDTAGADHLTAFEARFKVEQITDTYNVFVGLAEEGLAAADTITDGGALKTTADFIGFEILEADGDAVNFIYQKASQTKQTIISGAHVPVADTYVKLGFLYNPTEPTSRRISIFVNNVEQSTYVTGTNIAAATFVDGEELAFLAGLKNGEGAAKAMVLDWWHFAQIIP